MTPHRAHSFAGITAAMKGAVAAPADVGAGVGAGLLTIAAAFWNLHVVLLLILVVGAGAVDLLVGARRAHYGERVGVDRFTEARLNEGVWSKATILIVTLFLGASLDSILILGGGIAELGFVSLWQTLTPITTAMLLYRWTKEAASIKRNLKQTPGGEDAIWEGFDLVVDELRYRMMHPGAERVPQTRWKDRIHTPPNVEELRQLLAEAEERESTQVRTDPPPPRPA